jgi:seryl-tRNA synthetase
MAQGDNRVLDIRFVRSQPEEIEKKLQKRDPSISLRPILDLDARWRQLIVQSEELKKKRNEVSELIGRLKKERKDASQYIAEMKKVSDEIKRLDGEVKELDEAIHREMCELPNIPDDSVPVGPTKEDAVLLREWGEKRQFPFQPRNHLELAGLTGMLDFARGAKLAESQFPIYVGMGALLEWALLSFMVDVQTRENGYTLILPPYLVNPQSMFTSGNLPKFEGDLYKLRENDLYLIPTSEVPLTSFHRDEILDEENLPLKYASYTACFRREAGTYGAEERGLIRVHQFNKVEMYKVTTPETSEEELASLVRDAEKLVERLGLHYRTRLLPTGDMALQSAKTCDVEVWLPAQQAYYEVSSCSNCKSFQAVRGNIRYRPKDGGKNRYVHTLNGSGLATSRLLVALLETYQQSDGGIVVPEELRKYLPGISEIKPKP